MRIFFITFLVILVVTAVAYGVYKIVQNVKMKKLEAERAALLDKSFSLMNINSSQLKKMFPSYNKIVVVKSRQSLDKYDLSSFFKENRDYFRIIKSFFAEQKVLIEKIELFLKDNPLVSEKEYPFIRDYFNQYKSSGELYCIRVSYVTKAGNCLDSKNLLLTPSKLEKIENTPELYMTKTEMKEIEKERLEEKKKNTYSNVSAIIDKANELKDNLITKHETKTLDELVAKLYDRTVNSVQKVKSLESEEWTMINKAISDINKDINKIKEKNDKLKSYYASSDFRELKSTCNLLMQSQKDFNSYIDEKIEAISKSFGTRITRNETENEDVYNYVRAYKKTVSPFTAELSSNVFSSAENNPIQYLLKCFYPNRSLYEEQIINLKNLLNELETLKDAKQIIENYKKDYAEYIVNVPKYVLEEDEDGFYSRLGFAVIDENVLNVEYKFVYTSNGGMAQRSFTIPMTEETIAELIDQLQNKLSTASIAKEQRALMTPKLRQYIKERDNYTCCICGNSTHSEPNLLLEIDHILPIAKGGLTVEKNLQTLCWKCNRIKGAKIY